MTNTTKTARLSRKTLYIALALTCLVLGGAIGFVAPLVVSPDRVSALPRPVADLGPLGRTEVVQPESVEELRLAFAASSYHLAAVREGDTAVPRLYVTELPDDLGDIRQTKMRKTVFLRTLLPLVLLANEEIRSTRARVEAILAKDAAGGELTPEETGWMAAVAEYYEIEEPTAARLLNKIDEIPVSLALAQGIVESGWGTSRFAREGKALFGERVFGGNAGIAAKHDSSARVRDFIDLMESVRSYMHNLNTHPAYDELRAARADSRRAGDEATGAQLALTLHDYAELEGYPQKIRAIIRQNKLSVFNDARLATGAVAERIDLFDAGQPAEG